MLPRLVYGSILVVLGLTVIGCGQSAGHKEPASTSRLDEHVGSPLTEAECRDFGKRVEAAIASGDGKAVDNLLPFRRIFEQCINEVDFSPNDRLAMLDRLSNQSSESTFANRIIDGSKNGTKFTFMRVRMKESPPRVVIRILAEDRALNYYQLPLVRLSDGSVSPCDIDSTATGEPINQTLRRLCIGASASRHDAGSNKFTKTERLYGEHIAKIQKMTKAARQGPPQEAIDAFNSLPPELQNDSALQLIALGVASKVGSELFGSMYQRFEPVQGKNPAFYLISVLYFRQRMECDKELECIAKVNESIGGDPYLTSLGGDALRIAGRYAEAKAACEKAIELEPTLEPAYWSRISVALAEKNHEDIATWLKKLVTRCNTAIDLEYIRQSAAYKDFAMSPEFQQFATWYAEKTK